MEEGSLWGGVEPEAPNEAGPSLRAGREEKLGDACCPVDTEGYRGVDCGSIIGRRDRRERRGQKRGDGHERPDPSYTL